MDDLPELREQCPGLTALVAAVFWFLFAYGEVPPVVSYFDRAPDPFVMAMRRREPSKLPETRTSRHPGVPAARRPAARGVAPGARPRRRGSGASRVPVARVEWFPTFGLLWQTAHPPLMSCPARGSAGLKRLIVRGAVQAGHVVDHEDGAVEDRLAAADRLLGRRQGSVAGARRPPRGEQVEARVGEAGLQRVVRPDEEGRGDDVLEVVGAAAVRAVGAQHGEWPLARQREHHLNSSTPGRQLGRP